MANMMYNEEIKERFLDTYENEDTKSTIRYTFYKTFIDENALDKDLYDFNLQEISNVIRNHSPRSNSVAKSIGAFISQYITWAIEEANLRKSNIHPMKALERDFYDSLVDKKTKIHYSEKELIDIVEKLDNAQDQALLFLWFEAGISGKDFSEIRNLTYYDIDWNNNLLTIKDEVGETRTLEVSDRCMRYLERAYKQETYLLYQKDGIIKEMPLMQGDYIFRNTDSRRTHASPRITFVSNSCAQGCVFLLVARAGL